MDAGSGAYDFRNEPVEVGWNMRTSCGSKSCKILENGSSLLSTILVFTKNNVALKAGAS